MRIVSLCTLCAVCLCLTADPAGAATRGRLELSGGMWLEFEDLRTADVHNRKEPEELVGPVRLRIFRVSSGGETRLEQVILVGESDNSEDYIGWPGEVEVRDYNLDGWLDISVPANAGNVMLFSSVYLYDKKTRQFIRSEAFSELPCLGVNSARKKVIGGCFHSSACENWTEEYDITGFDTLSKTLQFGTMCGPPDAEPSYYLSYETIYENGKQLSHMETRHED